MLYVLDKQIEFKKMLKILIKNSKIQKSIASLTILAIIAPIVFFSVPPQKAEAQWFVTDLPLLGIGLKEIAQDIWKQAKMLVARRIINSITQRTVNWINSGFHGNPFYLENSKSFFKDIAKHEITTFVNVYGYDRIKFPFGRDVALSTIDAYRNQLQNNSAYTLSKVTNDPIFLDRYQNDFNFGGWDAFFINTQYPQNNYIGFNLEVDDDLARKLAGTVQTKAEQVQDTLQKGQGFLAPQTCKGNPAYNNGKNEFVRPQFDEYKFAREYPIPPPPDTATSEELIAYSKAYDVAHDKAKAEWATTNECPGGLTTTTPGSVIGDQIKINLQSKVRQGELAAALGNAFAAVFDALVNKLLNEGLNKLSSAIPESTSTTENFNYTSGIREFADKQEPNPTCELACQAEGGDGGSGGSASCRQTCGGGEVTLPSYDSILT